MFQNVALRSGEQTGVLEPLTAGFSEANFLLISLRCSKVGSEEEKHNKAVLETAENKKQIGRKKD